MTGNSYQTILQRLIATRKSIANWRAIGGVIDLLAYLFGLAFIFWLITGLFWPDSAARMIILILSLIGAFGIIGLTIIKPFIIARPLTQVALLLEKYYGKLQSRLIGSLQLYDKLENNPENYSIELIEKTIEDAGAEIKDLDFGVVVEKSKTPYYRLAPAAILVILAVLVSPVTMNNMLTIFSHPLANIPRPTNLTLTITPKSLQAIKNDDVTVKIAATGDRVRRVDFHFQYAGDNWVKVAAEKTESDTIAGLYSYTFRKLKRDVEFYAEANDVRSSTGNITIVDPPRLNEVAITLDFPKYTGLPDQKLPNNDGSVTALKGTVVNFQGQFDLCQ
jgi:hypothetical protein